MDGRSEMTAGALHMSTKVVGVVGSVTLST